MLKEPCRKGGRLDRCRRTSFASKKAGVASAAVAEGFTTRCRTTCRRRRRGGIRLRSHSLRKGRAHQERQSKAFWIAKPLLPLPLLPKRTRHRRPVSPHANALAIALCLATRAPRSIPSGEPSTTRHRPATMTRSARWAPQRTRAAIGSCAPLKRGSSRR